MKEVMKGAIKFVHKQIDEIIEQEKKCCTKGCSFCCYQQIEIVDIEKEVIIDFLNDKVDENTKEIIKENLNNWLDFFDENTPNNKVLNGQDVFVDFKNKIGKRGLKCPLLIDNLCSIYEMRPITCRIHYAEHSPEKCDENKTRDSARNGIGLRGHFIESIKSLGETSLESLPLAITKTLLPERKIKLIEKIILK
jgi:Fe-S-cluster containining protein